MPLTKGGLPVRLSNKPASRKQAPRQAAQVVGIQQTPAGNNSRWKGMPSRPVTLLDALTDPDPLFPFTEDDDILFERVGLKPRRG